MSRPILLGMVDPTGTEPLGIDVPGSAGERLWRMSGMPRDAYLRSFERRNLLARRRTWDRDSAIVAARDLRATLSGRVVVVLGTQTWGAFRFRGARPPPCGGVDDLYFFTKFYFVPHPSGKNLYYNDRRNRQKVRRLLRRLVA